MLIFRVLRSRSRIPSILPRLSGPTGRNFALSEAPGQRLPQRALQSQLGPDPEGKGRHEGVVHGLVDLVEQVLPRQGQPEVRVHLQPHVRVQQDVCCTVSSIWARSPCTASGRSEATASKSWVTASLRAYAACGFVRTLSLARCSHRSFPHHPPSTVSPWCASGTAADCCVQPRSLPPLACARVVQLRAAPRAARRGGLNASAARARHAHRDSQ